MRTPGKTARERFQLNAVPVSEAQPSDVCRCRCSKRMVIDGVEYVGTDPGCPEHGFEAQTKARAQYIAEAAPREGPVNMKGRDSR